MLSANREFLFLGGRVPLLENFQVSSKLAGVDKKNQEEEKVEEELSRQLKTTHVLRPKSGAASSEGSVCRPVTSHLRQQDRPNVMTSSNAANECSFHFPNLNLATDRSFVAQRILDGVKKGETNH